MDYTKYLITEAVKMDSTEKAEWGKLIKWAKSQGFKQYKNGKQNPMWSDEEGITYVDGWALDEDSGFAIYLEDGDEDVYITYYVGGGPSGNDSITKGYAKKMIDMFFDGDDRIK